MYNDNDYLEQVLGRTQKKQGILDRVKQNVINPQADNAYKAGMMLFGQKPQEDDGATRLANQMALMQFKSTLPGKPAQEYFTIDENGNPVPIEGMAGRKPVPVGYTKPYQDAAEARANYSKAGVPLREEQTETAEATNRILNDYASGISGKPNENNQQLGGSNNVGNVPPGTVINAGPLKVPLNPELTENEARAFGTLPVLDKAVSEFKLAVQKDTLESNNPFQSAYRGLAVDSGYAPFTFGNKETSDMQAALNRIKANTLFAEGGKTLTANERAVVENLFNVTGKSKERILKDVDEGIRKYHEFVNAKQQGMMGYNSNISKKTNDLSSMSDEEIKAKLASLTGGA